MVISATNPWNGQPIGVFSSDCQACGLCAAFEIEDTGRGRCIRKSAYCRADGTCPDWTPWDGAFVYAEEETR